MLQWKPIKLIALVAILVVVAALTGQFSWESFAGLSAEQFSWQ